MSRLLDADRGNARRHRGGGGHAGGRCPRAGRGPGAAGERAIGHGVVTERRDARADDFHSAPDLFRPTGRNLRGPSPLRSALRAPVSVSFSLSPSRDAADWN